MPVPRVKSSNNRDDGRLKRVSNPYILYRQAVAKGQVKTKVALVDDNGRRLSQKKLSGPVGAVWKSLSEEEQAPWRKRFQELKEQRKRDHPDYKYRPGQAQKASPKDTGNVEGRKAKGSRSRRQVSDPASALPSGVASYQGPPQYATPLPTGNPFAIPSAPIYPGAGYYPRYIAQPAGQSGFSQVPQQVVYFPIYHGLPNTTHPTHHNDPRFSFPPAGQPGPSQISQPFIPHPAYAGPPAPMVPTYPAHAADQRSFAPSAGQMMPANAQHPRQPVPPYPAYPTHRADPLFFSPPAGQANAIPTPIPTPAPAARRLPFPIQPQAAAPPTPVSPAPRAAPPAPAARAELAVRRDAPPVFADSDDDAFLIEMGQYAQPYEPVDEYDSPV